jgi:hypothetical protein
VTASRVAGAGTIASGPRTVLTQADIGKVASVNRDVRDVERRDPLPTSTCRTTAIAAARCRLPASIRASTASPSMA